MSPSVPPTRLASAQDLDAHLASLTPETWPARHKLHKYWGRKPANIVAAHIELFSRPGEVVLDPFSGSGVTLVEAARLGRVGRGIDFNAVAVQLGQALVEPPDAIAFRAAAARVRAAAEPDARRLFATECRACAATARVRSFGWEGSALAEVRYHCAACRARAAAPPEADDLTLAARRVRPPFGTPDGVIHMGWQMQKLRRKRVRRWRELFTPRSLRVAGLLRAAIQRGPEPLVRRWLELSLSAALAQMSRMIADYRGRAGGPSWKINCYWLPERWQELEPIGCFDNRVTRALRAIEDLRGSGAPWPDTRCEQHDSRQLPFADESVDYIFTDPPYGGEGIQYGELSMLWALWLGKGSDLDAEIAFNPGRGLDHRAYAERLDLALGEAYRVLRPGRWMTVTFANKERRVWQALLDACASAGFELVRSAPMRRSAPALTEINAARAPKADMVLCYRKPGGTGRRRRRPPTDIPSPV